LPGSAHLKTYPFRDRVRFARGRERANERGNAAALRLCRPLLRGDTDWIPGAPDIAIEVLSPGNAAQDIELKIAEYLAAGGKSVWVVSPKSKHVRIYRADGTWTLLDETETLSAESVLPGFALSLSELFAEL
jgi:Uma2 family endonuclease